MYLHQVLAQSIVSPDEADGRVYGWLPGVVTDVDTKLMQVKARIGKMEDGESTHWLVPMGMGSVESLPEVGDPVGVLFADGDPHAGAYFYYPQSTTNGRPTKEPVPLGLSWAAMYNDLATKLNNLISHYQAFYTAVQNHSHASLGSPSVALSAATIDATCKDTSSATGLCKAADGSVVGSSSDSKIVLSKRTKVR